MRPRWEMNPEGERASNKTGGDPWNQSMIFGGAVICRIEILLVSSLKLKIHEWYIKTML